MGQAWFHLYTNWVFQLYPQLEYLLFKVSNQPKMSGWIIYQPHTHFLQQVVFDSLACNIMLCQIWEAFWKVYSQAKQSKRGGGRRPCAKAEGAFTWGAGGGAEDKVPPQLPLSAPSLFGWGAWPQVKGIVFFFQENSNGWILIVLFQVKTCRFLANHFTFWVMNIPKLGNAKYQPLLF